MSNSDAFDSAEETRRSRRCKWDLDGSRAVLSDSKTTDVEKCATTLPVLHTTARNGRAVWLP